MNPFTRLAAGLALAAGVAASASAADLKVGLVTALSGPTSSIGIPYSKGMQAALAYQPEIAGRKVQLIVIDDASDPSTAGRNARKLVSVWPAPKAPGSSRCRSRPISWSAPSSSR
jgi:branched-chain amino acid transport system substrate-binding protein